MSHTNVTSEWKECRDSIARFDGYLFRLRLSAFTVFTLAFSTLVGGSSLKDVEIIFQRPENILFIFSALCTYILAIYILDRYYERMLMIAVYRASYIETFRLENFKIGLTTEIEFQKERMLKEAKKKPFFLKFGLKGSEMVNVIFLFLFILVSAFCFSIFYRFGGANAYNHLGIYIIIFFGFLLLGISANGFLSEPKKLIKLRSQAVKSPIIMSREEIKFIINRMAKEVHAYYVENKLDSIVLVSILQGARPFTAALMEKLEEKGMNIDLHLLRVVSTQENRHADSLEFIFGQSSNFRGKNILILDDLIDQGKTIEAVKKLVSQDEPAQIKVAALINKYVDVKVHIDFVGINMGLKKADFPLKNGITDYWLFGFGMDLNEQFRDLDFVGWIEKKD